MRRTPLAVVVAGALILAFRGARALAAPAAAPAAKTPVQEKTAAKGENVPLYTNADLERMFGPPSPDAVGPVVNTTPDDWGWVQRFLDREYARIDADRRHELDRRAVGSSYRSSPSYVGYPVAWSLGFPASVWWNDVHRAYRQGLRHDAPPHDAPPRARGRALRR